MRIVHDERKKIIEELQKIAENVLSLKAERRQKHPIVIEFSGSPKAGKTSCINSLELFLKRNGFTVRIVQERASVCPVSNKQSPMFNLWTACTSLSGLIGTLEDKKNQVDVLILDRGVFDALCWFDWLVTSGKMENEQRLIAESFLLMEDIVKTIDIVFSFCVEPDVSIEREYATLLTDKTGTIMNKKVLSEYSNSINRIIETKKKHFHSVFAIDTTNKNQDEVGKEVTEITLNTLKNLLMERVGYFEKNDKLEQLLLSDEIIPYSELTSNLRESSGDTGKYSRQNYYGESITVGNQRDKERDSISKEQINDRDNGFTKTGWESERENLINGERTEECEQYIGRTEKEMATDIDWSTNSNTNPILDGIYTLASATEIIRKPTTKTPRQTKNKKKGLGQREDDHSGDYHNNNELYYGQSI